MVQLVVSRRPGRAGRNCAGTDRVGGEHGRMNESSDPPKVQPDEPLAGPPDPWQGADQPVDRGRPPWFMTEMIAAEPAFAARCLSRLAADGSAARLAVELRLAAAAGAPVVVAGCGTSEHGAIGVAAILDNAWRAAGLAGEGPVSVQAFEASLEPRVGLCIAISHDGGTWATSRALEAARAAGARTAIITVSGRAPGAQGIDVVLETLERDQSYCHTIGYTSPLLAATAVGAALTGQPVDPAIVRGLMAAGIDGLAGQGRPNCRGREQRRGIADRVAVALIPLERLEHDVDP